MLDVYAKITGIHYKPYVTKNLKTYDIDDLKKAIEQDTSFIIKKNNKTLIAFSWWVSAKRTRSYPYERVYNTLDFSGKKVTLIPVFKDEGADGDQDFIQWDTISLMSLLGVYVIISYYSEAEKNDKYKNKITSQKYNILHLKEQLHKLCNYQSDALHWNLCQAEFVPEIGNKAVEAYQKISTKLGVKMTSKEGIQKKLIKIKENRDEFMNTSRTLAQNAQNRESATIQPKENLSGTKGKITITNYLGGNYYFTSDEIEIKNNNMYLIEGKHTSKNQLPSIGDIKDGLVKMILFSNLKEAVIGKKKYSVIAQLKLTVNGLFNEKKLNKNQKITIEKLMKEAKHNGFQIKLNDKVLDLKNIET